MGDHHLKVSLPLGSNLGQHGGGSQVVRHLVVSQTSAGSNPVHHPFAEANFAEATNKNAGIV